jgi:hypothetical protein
MQGLRMAQRLLTVWACAAPAARGTARSGALNLEVGTVNLTTGNFLDARQFATYGEAFDYAVCLGISAAPLRALSPDRNYWVVTVPDFDTGEQHYVARA